MSSKVRQTIILIIIFCISNSLNAQSKIEEIIEKRVEALIDQTEETIDLESIIQNLYSIYENPINLNGNRLSELLENNLISEFQFFKINQHLESYGSFLEIEELLIIEGFNEQKIDDLRAFITVIQPSQQLIKKVSLKRLKQNFLLDFIHPLQKSQGYQKISESEFQNSPNSVYLGEVFKLKGRYKIENRKIQSGLIFEKDQGEILFNNPYNKVSQNFLDRNPSRLDYFSAHLMIKDIGLIKKFIVGDYQLQFGQALGLWSNMGFGKSSDVNNVKKFANGIKANTSSNENHFFRGLASTIEFKNWNLSFFYSSKNRDANLIYNALENSTHISSIQNTGLHRTVNELNDKNSLNEKISGFNITYRFKSLKLGSTFYTQLYNLPIYPALQIQNEFKFRGKENNIISFDYHAMFNRIELFGEVARSKNKSIAILSGLNYYFSSLINMSLIYRDYSKDFQNSYSEAFSEASNAVNEKGIYIGLNLSISPKIKISMYSDNFVFPWVKSQQYSPNHGSEQLFQIDYTFQPILKLYIRYKQQKKTKSSKTESNWFKVNQIENKKSLRLHLSLQINEKIKLQNRIEFRSYKLGTNSLDQASLVFQDFQYTSIRWPLKLNIRYVSFNSDSFQSRIYTYENDLIYNFSIPSFNNIGNRIYFLISYKLSDQIGIRFKYARTSYKSASSIGSGKDQINGNKKSEIKFQLKLKL